MKKIVSAILLLSLICLCGCTENFDNDDSNKRELLTIEEIENEVINLFCNEDGSYDTSYWVRFNSRNYHPEMQSIIDGVGSGDIKIEGFSIQFIKGLDENDDWYLVEFEPSGHLVGKRDTDFSTAGFRVYPSPFKLCNVEKENRYVDTSSYYHGLMQGITYLSKSNDYLCDFGSEALNKYVSPSFSLDEDFAGFLRTYNQETNEWEYISIEKIKERNKNV